MLKTRLLNGIFFAALTLTGFLLAYIYLFVHPAYRELLVDHAEDEAVRYVTFLVHAFDLEKLPIEKNSIPPGIATDVGRYSRDEQLIKLRVFAANGEIVFSTMPKEIGELNERDYFHKQVAAGQVYSKSVTKDNFSAEMEVVKTDLVETYVPIMAGDHFRGAVETYYDVTRSTRAITRLTTHSLVSLAVVSFFLLGLLYYALQRADLSIVARLRAENELRRTNEELEERVAERTGELVVVNRNLNDEVAEKNLAQAALSSALAEMEQAKDKIDGIIRSVSDGLLVIDQDGKIVLMNRPAEDVVGVSMQDASGRSIHEIAISDSLRGILTNVIATPETAKADFEQERAVPGRSRIFQARSSVLRDRDGSPLGSVILMQDVTMEREIEQMKLDFLAMAAHELVTPLAAIMGFAELLASETAQQFSDKQKEEFVHYIYRKADGLSSIVDDLLDISRIESGHQISIVRSEFDLGSVLERLVEAYRKTNGKHEYVLARGCQDCRVFADQVRLEQVLENLLSNAVKYSPDGGEIRIECRCSDRMCWFTVVDHGIGMTPEQVSHVFDKFYRADESNTARQGIGLGMSIARHIVEAHGGDIVVESEPGKGTTVSFSVPINAQEGLQHDTTV